LGEGKPQVRILATGGAGFIGSHFVNHVLEITNHEVVVLDALSYAGDVGRLTDLPAYDRDRASIFWHDLRAPIYDGLAERIDHIDWIVNFASDSHVDRSIKAPVPFVENNVSLMLNLLEYARIIKPRRFVQVSTDEVYGDIEVGASKEWDTIRPSNPYAASKAAQEALCYSYWRTFQTPLIITNTMNNFGERQHPEKFVPLVIGRIMRREPIGIHGVYSEGSWKSGSRYWLHAKNHADAVLWLLENHVPVQHPAASLPSRFNVVGDEEHTNLEIVSMVEQIIGNMAYYHFEDFHSTRPGHDLRYALDGTKLKAAGWTPPLSFAESFKKTVEWYEK
jgi:dTDP-glucose 4,6-dehydratase